MHNTNVPSADWIAWRVGVYIGNSETRRCLPGLWAAGAYALERRLVSDADASRSELAAAASDGMYDTLNRFSCNTLKMLHRGVTGTVGDAFVTRSGNLIQLLSHAVAQEWEFSRLALA